MSKIVATEIYLSPLPKGETAVSFIVEDRYIADMFVRELKHLDKIEVSAKAFSGSRSLRQNRFMWALIGKISEVMNGERSKESTTKIYVDLLKEAQAKRDLIAVLPEAIDTLKAQFRAVVPTGETIRTINKETGREAELVSVWVYYGSSKFNIKEMTELLDITIAYAGQLGIHDSEIESMRAEYE